MKKIAVLHLTRDISGECITLVCVRIILCLLAIVLKLQTKNCHKIALFSCFSEVSRGLNAKLTKTSQGANIHVPLAHSFGRQLQESQKIDELKSF